MYMSSSPGSGQDLTPPNQSFTIYFQFCHCLFYRDPNPDIYLKVFSQYIEKVGKRAGKFPDITTRGRLIQMPDNNLPGVFASMTPITDLTASFLFLLISLPFPPCLLIADKDCLDVCVMRVPGINAGIWPISRMKFDPGLSPRKRHASFINQALRVMDLEVAAHADAFDSNLFLQFDRTALPFMLPKRNELIAGNGRPVRYIK